MAWETELTTTLRFIVGDYTSPYQYVDKDLQQLILIASIYVQEENTFDVVYNVDNNAFTITPDPTMGGNRNVAFIWLCTLKAATILADGELKKSGKQAIKIKDGTSAIDLSGTLEAIKLVAKQFKDEYEDARWKYAIGIRPAGQGILGPTSVITGAVYGQAGGLQSLAARDRPLFN